MVIHHLKTAQINGFATKRNKSIPQKTRTGKGMARGPGPALLHQGKSLILNDFSHLNRGPV